MIGERLINTIERSVTNGVCYFDNSCRPTRSVENDLSMQIHLGSLDVFTDQLDKATGASQDLHDMGRMENKLFYSGAEAFVRFRGVKGVMRALSAYQEMNPDALGYKIPKTINDFSSKKDFIRVA